MILHHHHFIIIIIIFVLLSLLLSLLLLSSLLSLLSLSMLSLSLSLYNYHYYYNYYYYHYYQCYHYYQNYHCYNYHYHCDRATGCLTQVRKRDGISMRNANHGPARNKWLVKYSTSSAMYDSIDRNYIQRILCTPFHRFVWGHVEFNDNEI